MENIRGQANLDDLELDFPTEAHSLDSLKAIQNIDHLDIKDIKHIYTILTNILQQDSLKASYPPLAEILAWIDKRAENISDIGWEDE